MLVNEILFSHECHAFSRIPFDTFNHLNFSLILTSFTFRIEHLHEPSLRAVPVTIFEQMRPKLVIFTSK